MLVVQAEESANMLLNMHAGMVQDAVTGNWQGSLNTLVDEPDKGASWLSLPLRTLAESSSISLHVAAYVIAACG